jgi:hypothetical protein
MGEDLQQGWHSPLLIPSALARSRRRLHASISYRLEATPIRANIIGANLAPMMLAAELSVMERRR